MRVVLSILGAVGIPLGAYLVALCARACVSAWAWGWMGLYLVAVYAAYHAHAEPRRAKIAGGLAFALLLLLGVGRHHRVHPMPLGRTVILPGATPGPWVDRLGDDADLGMLLFVALADFGGVSRDDGRRARPYLRAAYRRLRDDPDFARMPSPIPSNLLGLTRGTAVHTLVLNPKERAPRAVILLPGVGGSSLLTCWLLARRMPDALILCPTVGLGGEWYDARGVEAWEQVLNYATAHSAGVYAIGMGYGARGLLHLANRNLLGHVAGFVLLAGFDENHFDQMRRSQIPVLVIRGGADLRTPPFRVEGLAGLGRVQSVEVPAGHFALYEQEDAVLERIEAFCGPR
mgnify:CR=1 FL=1